MLDPLKPVVDQWLAREPRLLATRVHQDLVRDYGFAGSYQTVRVERSRPLPHPELERRFETAPGHQAQVDWSYEQPLTTGSGSSCRSIASTWCWGIHATRSAGWRARWTW
jgi:hypothetical protein